jgi:hypothetical protein
MADLTMQQQSVLVLAARGPDGVAKHHPCKDVVRAYRGSVLLAAKFGRPLRWGESADTFMSLELIADDQKWAVAVQQYFYFIDELPHHYHMHLMHGAQVLGYKHPHGAMRTQWLWFYHRCVSDAHLAPETEEEMDRRLGDWGRRRWDEEAA